MDRLTFRVLSTVAVLLLISSISQSRKCLTDPKCYCTSSKIGIEIWCKDAVDVQPINDLLKNFTRVHSLRIYGKYLKPLKSRCFENQTIEILEISSPLETMADDALASIKSLEIVNLNGTMFTTIPKGAASPDFRILEMTHGALQSIDDQLQAMTTTADFLFSNNKISYIAENAFASTTALTNLDLSHNLLKTLNTSTFSQALNLRRLNLAYNQLLTVDGIFHHSNLETLNLYGNNLNDVDNAFNKGLFILKSLDLGKNPNLNISGSTFGSSMKKLTTLNLDDNQFKTLHPDLIQNLNYLHNLNLNRNNLSDIPTDFFAGSKYIRNIELSSNNIKSMKNLLSFSTLRELPDLKNIALDNNKISSVNIDNFYQRVLHLDLSGNQLTDVKEMDFMNLTSATSLNLSRNPLSDVQMRSFANLLKLHSLDLSGTKIKTLNQSLANLDSLSYLRITSSYLESIDGELKGLKNLKFVYLDGNNIVSVMNAFSDISNLTAIDLARNKLTTLMNGSLPTVHLKSHSLKKLWFAENPLSCDCRLLWMLEWLKDNHSRLEDEPLCQSPSNLRGIALRDLNKTLLEDWKEDCPKGCDCKCIVADLNVSTTVDCSNKHLVEKPSIFPRNAQNIDISGNKLTSMEFNTADYPRLEVLNLEGNELKAVNLELSFSKVNLYLSGNNLSRVPFESWNDTNLNQITLSLNPWICDCKTWNFRQWLLIHNSSIKDIQEIKCGDSGKLNNKVIINLSYEDLCPRLSEDRSIIIIAIFSVLLLMTCFVFFLFRKILMAIFFACGCRCLKTDEDYDYSFDAFLLFADEDDEFALGVIEEAIFYVIPNVCNL